MPSPNGRRPPNPQKVPKSHGKRPSNPVTAPRNNGRRPAPPPQRSGKTTCCAMVAAYGAARRRNWPLARRYAVWSVRLIAARIV